MKTFYIIIILLLSFTSCKKDINDEPTYPLDEKVVIENQKYSTYSRNVMDIYLCKDRTSTTPALILIHGGGWVEGDKSDFKDWASYFSDSAINAITINYRYADAINGVNYNDLLEDIGNAIYFLKNNSKKYGSNFDKITLFGLSAGGHLSLLYAYKIGNVNGAISMAGPTDFSDTTLLNLSPASIWMVNNIVGSENPEDRILASPITYANSTKTLLYHGKLDIVVPYSQSERLFNKISSLNPKNRYTLFDNCGHGFERPEAIWQIANETIKFVKE